ncbi:tRNA uridine-5-carboxymethylaminomethyl(34) synthesis GTPase MnmE [Blastomonas sp.]|uniref:tRNA uridine-5-carboxymethylaminomethyl(34) synthesis GTPase MnmE n=1 Tax=Blastomonas sp. TaxID=1909299 RepID=UPI002627CA7C|nr:tRNA uridine-5-carboxymethylaminomethyl(34) synthesis GTPase MnmE [Blastomonas sp.]MDM7955845.1 tRNA uridine-5-carboxymethylaminomethyl(34) synthesis GTPase MnmE [Blastomonas sp.]
MHAGDTIFALSSGAPPAALAIIRISGPGAGNALAALSGGLPSPRHAVLRSLQDPDDGGLLDRALVLWFPGPTTATGEDLAELHLHGGRAVVRAVEAVLARMPDLRLAEPGEFTRRAFLNGRMDLAEAEGLSDLLFAETEAQRVAAIRMASGHLSRQVESWRQEVLRLSALIEAELDFSDEDDVASGVADTTGQGIIALASHIGAALQRPRAERLRDGIRVVLAGPPNSGKSTLLNALVQREAAIVSDIAGTTRDLIEVPVGLKGIPFVFTDTAGLRDEGAEVIEAIGIDRARDAMAVADILLWLGPEGQGGARAWEIETQIDRIDVSRETKTAARHRLSARTGIGLDGLIDDLVMTAQTLLPGAGDVALNARQHRLLSECTEALDRAGQQDDLLLRAESLRHARLALDQLLGRTHVEDMLDALFGNFCIGK